jgi:hypothetical protein
MARSGLANLLTRLRTLAADPAGTAQWYTDDELAVYLENSVTYVEDAPLRYNSDRVAGSVRYHRAFVPYRDFEEAASGTIYWRVADSTGSEIGTASYTPDYAAGRLRFAADTGGSALYLTARSYDLHAAARDVWLAKASAMAERFQFSSDGQSFHRQQAYDHAMQMAELLGRKAGSNVGGRGSGDVRVVGWQRTDLARWG